jgi:hypothetical protein
VKRRVAAWLLPDVWRQRAGPILNDWKIPPTIAGQTITLSRNCGRISATDASLYSRRTKILKAPRQKPKNCHYCFYKSQPLVSPMHWCRNFPSYFKTHFHIILPPAPWSLKGPFYCRCHLLYSFYIHLFHCSNSGLCLSVSYLVRIYINVCHEGPGLI